MKPFFLSLALAISLPVASASSADWALSGDATHSSITETGFTLSLPDSGEVAASAEFTVEAYARLNLSFTYAGEGLGAGHPVGLAVRWLDAAGEDVDVERSALGFPPAARIWMFTQNASASDKIAVSDNLTAPERAVKAVVEFRLEKPPGKSSSRGAMSVVVSSFALNPGEGEVRGIEVPDSGPADAGPLSTKPDGHAFVENLVANGALEEGEKSPVGWRIEGDNRNNSAEWISGGAFSGRHAFKLTDRGPYVKSWDRAPGDPFVPGAEPGGNYSEAREEVSARWVSEPVPATPGAAYQAAAFLWYANRSYIDRGMVNPVRIQFLDAKGEVIPPGRWDDWLPDRRVLTTPGWVFVAGKPVTAPENAASLRTVVALHHAFYDRDQGSQRKLPTERGFILVDNIAVFELPEDADLENAGRAFAAAAAAEKLPFVPSSPAHRPSNLEVVARTEHPGGLIIVDPDKGAAEASLALDVTNYLGDARNGKAAYEIVDIDENVIAKGEANVTLNPYGQADAAVSLPEDLPYGPYLLRYALTLDGEKETTQGVSRFGTMPPRSTSVEERGRMDYPFSLWMHTFRSSIGTPEEVVLGRLADSAGVGKTWFGAGNTHLEHFVRIQDPEQRKEAIAEEIRKARENMAAWRKYGVTPMAALQGPNLLEESEYPVLAETVAAFVNALKEDGITQWRWGTESMHGRVRELDRATVEDGTVSGQGGSNYLYWGRRGTVRQYWAEYFVAYNAAKEADPNSSFGPQVASDTGGNVLRLFFKLGTAKDLDTFGMNTYISAFSIWPANVRQLEDHGAGDTPLHASEFSADAAAANTGEGHLAEEKAASHRMVAYWVAVLDSFPTIFHLEQWGLRLGDDDRSLTYQGAIRPQYLAYATMTNVLGAGTFTARHDLPGAMLYVRDRSEQDGAVGVLWSKDRPIQVDIEVDAEKAEVIDLWGNRTELPVTNGVVTVEAGPQLVYVVGGKGMKPAAGVGFEVTHATTEAGKYRVKVNLKNETRDAISGELEFIADGPLRVTERKRTVDALEPGAAREFFFDVEPVVPMRDERIGIRIRLDIGSRVYESSESLNFHSASRAELSEGAALPEWTDEMLTQVANRADQVHLMNSPKPWGGPEDLSAVGGFQWDDDNLYVKIRVTDDLYYPPEAEVGMWNRDVIEFLVDVNRTLVRADSFTMFSLAEFPEGPQVQRWDGPLPQGDVPGGNVTVEREGTVTTYTASIPWKEIDPDFTPEPGRVIALCWSADDHDGGDTRRRCISWFSHATHKNAAQFGDLLLTR